MCVCALPVCGRVATWASAFFLFSDVFCFFFFSKAKMKSFEIKRTGSFIIFSQRFMCNLPLWLRGARYWKPVISAQDLVGRRVNKPWTHNAHERTHALFCVRQNQAVLVGGPQLCCFLPALLLRLPKNKAAASPFIPFLFHRNKDSVPTAAK